MNDKLHLNLLENAHDFIETAIQYAREDQNRSWKYALLNLASALELVMKANLEKEHWSLLFEDVDVSSKADLKKGRFKSVDFETAINRLKSIVAIPISRRDEKYLRKIRDIRNRIMHFSIEIHLEELKSIVARGLGIFICLYEKLSEEEDSKEFIYHLNKQLKDFQKYVDLRLALLKEKLESAERPAHPFSFCSNCFQDTLIVNDDAVCCLFCGYETTFEDLSHTSEGPGGPCPECEQGHLGFILYTNDDGEFICVKCGYTTDYSHNDECTRCGKVFWNETGESMCDECWEYIANQD